MKLYDISQAIFGCEVYPEDTAPSKSEDRRVSRGDLYNLTSFSMCAHNGTHIDAPFHFFEDGDTVEQIPLEKTAGWCYVAEQNAPMDGEAAERIVNAAKSAAPEAAKRILIKGKGIVSIEAAKVFAGAGVWLIGVESQTVGPFDAPMAVHKLLLSENVALLEGVRLGQVGEGVYFLSATPLCLNGADGAPCRAILIEREEGRY